MTSPATASLLLSCIRSAGDEIIRPSLWMQSGLSRCPVPCKSTVTHKLNHGQL